jgi:hypothetical protein
MNKLYIRDSAGWTMLVFGLLALFLGVFGLIDPEGLLSFLGFAVAERAGRAAGDYTLAFTLAAFMASLNVGAYYVLAALNDLKKFYLWTVPFRLLTCTAFTLAVSNGLAPRPFLGIGLWEGLGALTTGAALYASSRTAQRSA